MLLIPLASAGIPWDCPTFTVPSDAKGLTVPADVEADLDALEAAAEAAIPAECVIDTMGRTSWEETCTSGEVTVTQGGTVDQDSYTTAVTVWMEIQDPSESWQSVRIETTEYESDAGSSSGRSLVWTGSFGTLPADGLYVASSSSSYDWLSGTLTSSSTVTTADCTLSYDDSQSTKYGTGSTRVGGNDAWVLVETYDDACDSRLAWVGDSLYGAVDENWLLDEADLDRDGYVDACDCDESDAAINTGAEDTLADGVDSDCDGVDRVTDLDGDGWDDTAVGGDDCDDTNDEVHPEAYDRAGDGIDADCDGADDVDADGDGYTADGTYLDPDCDDEAEDVHPGADEELVDGIDQDCDGEDLGDADGDGAMDASYGGADCDETDPAVRPGADETCDGVDSDCDGEDCARSAAPDEGCGCGGGGSAWLLLPLLTATRRRRAG